MRRITTGERRQRLGVRHRLAIAHRTNDVASIALDLAALHSSDPSTVFLSAGARMNEPSVGSVERALYEDRSLVRHHAFRRTLWVMTPAVARLAHASATAKIATAERRKFLGVLEGADDIYDGEAWRTAALSSVRMLLATEGPMPTREIGTRLPDLTRSLVVGAGTKHAAEVAAHTRLLLLAGFDGELVRSAPSHGWNSSEYAWSDTETWLGTPLTGVGLRPAAAEFLALWLDRFGPATETDMRWWTGWTLGQVRTALTDIGAEKVLLDGNSESTFGWVAGDDATPSEPEPWIALLPGLDPTTMGWKERSWYLGDVAAARTFDRSGNAGPTIWRNGEVVGGWAQRGDGMVAVELYAELTKTERAMLDEQIDRFHAFVGDTRVRVRFPAANQPDLMRS